MIATAALVLATSSLLFSALALLVGWREVRALVRLAPRPLERPLLVVIPARNEPEIARALQAVLADPHPALRVVIVDDRSTDDTAARAEAVCARDGRASVLRLDDEPAPGVFGKPRALDRGDRSVASDYAEVLFLDADVVLETGALGALQEARARTGASALSGVVHLETRGVLESLWVPTLAGIVTARFAPSRVHADTDATAFLNGQVILVERAALRAVGGWMAFAGTVLEDVALARALKKSGSKLRLCDLRALASTRMYASLSEIVEGFGKNATALLGPRAGLHGVTALLVASLPWAAVSLSATSPVLRGWIVAAAAAAVLCAVLARRLAGVAAWPALVLPLSYAGVAWVLVRASLQAARGKQIVWKGRSYGA